MNSEESFIMKAIKGAYSAFAAVAPTTATKILFKKYLGYKLDLKNPQTLNAKMQYLKLYTYRNNDLVTRCSDKYAVRDYVVDCGCRENLVELLGVWDKAEDIDFETLPEKFVLKCNHGSGSNIICTDKSKLNREEACRSLNRWLREDFGKQRVEMSYSKIERKIIAESFIETVDGKPPKDYKLFCSYGEPKFLFVASDRHEDKTKFDYFTMNWEWMPVKNGHPNAGAEALPRPEGFDDMITAARKLSKPFPLVRVDFYYEGGRVLFGELTFLHFGGLTPFDPANFDSKLGQLMDTDVKQGMANTD